jgi:hypothetical protein
MRARGVLGWALLFFVGGQLALSLALDNIASRLRASDYEHKRQGLAALRRRHPDRPLVLMLGSSRTLDGFQAGRLDGRPGPDGRPIAAFNFGLILTGPIKENLHVQTLLDEGVRPRLLLVEVLPPLLNAPGGGRKGEEDWIRVEMLSATDLARLWPYCVRPGRAAEDWVCSRLLPAYYHRPRIMGSVAQSWLDPAVKPQPEKLIDRWGYSCASGQRILTPSNCWRWTGQAYQMFGAPLRGYRLGTGATRALRDLLDRCREEGVPVGLVLMPEGSAFRAWYPPEADEAVAGLLADLQGEYGVAVIDARTWVPDHGFWDSHHMLPAGAEVFTAKLIPEVERLLEETR